MTDERSYSSFALLSMALDHARLLLVIPGLCAAVALGLTLIFGRGFVAESTFQPDTSSPDVGRLAGLASQLGFPVGRMSEGESVEFYVSLAESRSLLAEVATDTFRFAESEGSPDTLRGTLLDLLEVKGGTPTERLRNATERLERDIDVWADVNSGIVTLRTRAPWAGLAVQVNRNLLEGIHRFNLEKRRSQARAEREFVEERVRHARSELEAAEADLRRFLEVNRRYDDSPQLRFEADGLQRRVSLRQQVYTSLAESFEKARLDEVRNTPVVTVIDAPEGSARRTWSPVRNTVLALLLGLLLVAGWIFLREYVERQRSEYPDDYRAFTTRRRELRGRVKSA